VVAQSLGMSPARTDPTAIDALAQELSEVEWFGRSSEPETAEQPSVTDWLLALAGALRDPVPVLVTSSGRSGVG